MRLYSPDSKLALIETGPEFAIGRAFALRGLDEDAMVLANNFGQRIAHRAQEILVRGDDGAIEVELDHRL